LSAAAGMLSFRLPCNRCSVFYLHGTMWVRPGAGPKDEIIVDDVVFKIGAVMRGITGKSIVQHIVDNRVLSWATGGRLVLCRVC